MLTLEADSWRSYDEMVQPVRDFLVGDQLWQLRKELKEPVAIVVAQFLPSLFQAQTLAEKNRRELKGLVERGQQWRDGESRNDWQDHLGSAILEV